MGGKLYPRGNPAPKSAAFQVTSTGACDVTFPWPNTVTRTDIDRVWLFRTLDSDTEAGAKLNAKAGDFYYVDSIPAPASTSSGTHTYADLFVTPTDDLVEYDNFRAPQFNFCIFIDPYWWGFGNFELPVAATWDSDGVVTFTDSGFVFYPGRWRQACYLKTGTDTTDVVRNYYAFEIVGSSMTCQLAVNLDGTHPSTFSAGSGYIVFNGPSTTLYRSKFRNPLAWGETSYVGNIRVPDQFYLKVGGGIGTGISQVPNIPLLVVSTKAPAATYTLDLRTAGTDNFAASKRLISSLYSTTSHFSQFAAATDNGSMVLWSHDADNFVILACDGNAIVPISQGVSQTLRALSRDKDLRRLVHGIYDPATQMNCLWVPRLGTTNSLDLLISQHAPTGNWHIQFEGDVLCSAILESVFCSFRHLYVGTERGMFGTGLDSNKTRNWLSEDLNLSGVVTVSNTIPGIDTDFTGEEVGPAILGNWILIVNPNTGREQWGRISAVTSTTVAVDKVYTKDLGWSSTWTEVPLVGNQYFIALIETSLLRYFDFQSFMEDRKLEELWVMMENTQLKPAFFQYFRDKSNQPLVLPNGTTNLQLEQVSYDDNTKSQQWMTTTPPTERVKVFGLRIVDRGYQLWKLHGWGGKYR